MPIQPDLNQFKDWTTRSRRVPICRIEKVGPLDPARLYSALFGDSPYGFLFESGKGPEATARYSFFGECHTKFLQIKNDLSSFSNNGSSETFQGNPGRQLDRLYFQNKIPAVDYLDHFWGGWVGYIGYEAAYWFEKLPHQKKDDLELLDLWFMEAERLFAYDHKTAELKYIVAEETDGDVEAHYRQSVEHINDTWNRHSKLFCRSKQEMNDMIPDGVTQATRELLEIPSLKANMTREGYISIVERAKKYIEEGDIYQANLAQRFEMESSEDPLELYQRLKAVNPSPFSGFMKFNDTALVSSSPERLVKVEKNILETRPIAGTRPRGRDPGQDLQLSRELLLNEKEKAEHLMLVDLERNDLGRICKYGSVKVTDLMFLEQYSHVTHIVSNVIGHLKHETSFSDLLRAVFPGGTITGCPKVRCMEIINELEPSCRGPYSGSFGYIGYAPYMDLNIIIRTIIIKGNKAFFHVGAGIVADSIPEKEYQETLDKAAAMIQALSMAHSPCPKSL